ncbi:zinc finger protein 79-like [Syngnathoides biaculeatus]|uniref:zinc finger protein 79-like n=1 Tax=Syngnathoides biaculeatus TaxID=300417 RepID=UPI002ADE4B1E|nr:zinc finger protein 79-like [Syngnathoides biaculeatus]
MCKVEMLRALLSQRLNAAFEEIFVVFERTIAEYEDELCRTKEENERQRQLLDAVFKKPQVVLHKPGLSDEDVPPSLQEWCFSVDQQEPDPPHVKEEKEDVWSSQEGEEQRGQELPLFRVVVKSDDNEDEPCSSQPHRSQHESRTSQADSLLAPLSNNDDATSHSLDTDDEHAKGDVTCHAHNTHVRCSDCGKNLGDTDTRCPAREKPFICLVCGKGFSRNEHLITHTRTHTGEKPFICSVCGGRFSQKGSLKKHMRTHTGEKPFSCSVCTKTFSDSSAMVRHLRRHTGEKPFTCSMCKANFTHRSALVTHFKVHTGEKPFPCSICSRRFSVKTQLTRHMKIHTGEKVFSCGVCNEGFLYNYQLTKHKCPGVKCRSSSNEAAGL